MYTEKSTSMDVGSWRPGTVKASLSAVPTVHHRPAPKRQCRFHPSLGRMVENTAQNPMCVMWSHLRICIRTMPRNIFCLWILSDQEFSKCLGIIFVGYKFMLRGEPCIDLRYREKRRIKTKIYKRELCALYPISPTYSQLISGLYMFQLNSEEICFTNKFVCLFHSYFTHSSLQISRLLPEYVDCFANKSTLWTSRSNNESQLPEK
jgi:hypothetical protein